MSFSFAVSIIFSEILIALTIQNISGNFIIKIFDIFTIFTLKYIYLLPYEQFYSYSNFLESVL